jgi:hypothetical protein
VKRLFDPTGGQPGDPTPLRRDRQPDRRDGERHRADENQCSDHCHHVRLPDANAPLSSALTIKLSTGSERLWKNAE